MKSIFLPTVLIAVLAGCASTVAPPADDIYQQRDALAQIWPGYDPVERGVGYYLPSDGQIVLIKDLAEAPTNFAPQSPGVWRSIQPDSSLRSSYYIDRNMGDVTATLARFSDNNTEPYTTLFHEAFHGYQKAAFTQSEAVSTLSQFDVGDMPLDLLVAALRRERQFLIGALRAENAHQHEQFALLYASIRHWREQQLPQSTVQVERAIETREGTANWYGYRAAQVVQHQSHDELIRELQGWLEFNHEEAIGSESMRLMTSRVYATGAALSELLSIAAEAQWQQTIADGAQLFPLLLDVYEWPQDLLARLAEQIIQHEAFENAVNDAQNIRWGLNSEQVLAEIKRRHNWQLMLYVPELQGNFSADGDAFTPLDDGAIILNPVTQFDSQTEHLNVQINNLTIIHMRDSESVDMEGGHHPALQVFLRRLPDDIQCEDSLDVCEGTAERFIGRGLQVISETPVRYRLQRLP